MVRGTPLPVHILVRSKLTNPLPLEHSCARHHSRDGIQNGPRPHLASRRFLSRLPFSPKNRRGARCRLLLHNIRAFCCKASPDRHGVLILSFCGYGLTNGVQFGVPKRGTCFVMDFKYLTSSETETRLQTPSRTRMTSGNPSHVNPGQQSVKAAHSLPLHTFLFKFFLRQGTHFGLAVRRRSDLESTRGGSTVAQLLVQVCRRNWLRICCPCRAAQREPRKQKTQDDAKDLHGHYRFGMVLQGNDSQRSIRSLRQDELTTARSVVELGART